MLARIQKAIDEREEGFTLIELLVVIIIIGILAAIAIPVFLSQRNKGYDAQAKSDLRNVATLEETFLNDNSIYTATVKANQATTATQVGYKPSSGAGTIQGELLTSAGAKSAATTGSAAAQGYCLWTTSNAGNVWTYNSVSGGLGGGTPTSKCP